ncbi:12087_t:CDS:2, partial [Entrophospora sp. SA101]
MALELTPDLFNLIRFPNRDEQNLNELAKSLPRGRKFSRNDKVNGFCLLKLYAKNELGANMSKIENKLLMGRLFRVPVIRKTYIEIAKEIRDKHVLVSPPPLLCSQAG